MGGFGSGNWYRMDKKLTVDESLTLTMRDFRDRIVPCCSGSVTWNRTNGDTSSIRYLVTSVEPPTIMLRYRWHDTKDVRLPIVLQTTPTQFGGQRLWFTCPLIVNGVKCNRRVGKLHLPPGAQYFGCRTCHDLTHRSCQEAHGKQRRVESIGRMKDRLDSLTKSDRYNKSFGTAWSSGHLARQAAWIGSGS
jgi:hypothetical protein